jgi:hypothetical protein
MPGCTVNKEKSGGKEDVKINTPIGGLHVSTDADVKDVGLALFPGALVKPDKDGDKNRANVNINTSLFGVKVVALEYTTSDSPAKVTEFYKKELAKYGEVLECAGKKGTVNFSFTFGEDKDKEHKQDCGKDHPSDGGVELKAGQEGSQHIVSIKPEGNGSSFALVYVRARGKGEGAL